MAAGDIVRTIVKFLSHEKSERDEAISLLYELSKSETLCEKIGSINGAILILVGMTSSKSENLLTIEKAEKTLENLERCESNVRQMADYGKLQPLLTLLLGGIGCIIGKNGSIINEIRKRTKADVRISKVDKPKCADDDDELVEVLGVVGSVRDALVQIVLRLRDDVLKDREVNQNPSDGVGLRSLYPVSADFSVPPVLPSIPPVGHLDFEQRGDTGSGLNIASTDNNYGYGCVVSFAD
ncbi:hypothetical protein POM88_050053 [Heracleum sosnowskyi]|uniref:K Homology domain-containing protein n=1 Tax=Heracleum sosnowskyi TaxID=360622 RepID=A0AAD8GWV7_9APIA|nr:hypothetical protein POM88_050053 [Heracleum sosnowskyi]